MTAQIRRIDAWQGISWAEVVVGQQVWLKGTHNGEFRAYGPHVVKSKLKKTLTSGTPGCKADFMHYSEELLIPNGETMNSDLDTKELGVVKDNVEQGD